jgi:hypothetical protein
MNTHYSNQSMLAYPLYSNWLVIQMGYKLVHLINYALICTVRLMGARRDWASTNCARSIQPRSGGYRQVHQVD